MSSLSDPKYYKALKFLTETCTTFNSKYEDQMSRTQFPRLSAPFAFDWRTMGLTQFFTPTSEAFVGMELLGVINGIDLSDPFNRWQIYQPLHLEAERPGKRITYDWSFTPTETIDRAARLVESIVSYVLPLNMFCRPDYVEESVMGMACSLELEWWEDSLNESLNYRKSRAPVLVVYSVLQKKVIVYKSHDFQFEYGKLKPLFKH